MIGGKKPTGWMSPPNRENWFLVFGMEQLKPGINPTPNLLKSLVSVYNEWNKITPPAKILPAGL
jgi:hypothetical protein